jgi:hypothetical protein
MNNNHSTFDWKSTDPEFDELGINSFGDEGDHDAVIAQLSIAERHSLQENRVQRLKDDSGSFDESRYTDLLQHIQDLIGDNNMLSISGGIEIINQMFGSKKMEIRPIYSALSDMILSRYSGERQVDPKSARIDSYLYFTLEMATFQFGDLWLDQPIKGQELESPGIKAILTLLEGIEDIKKVNEVLSLMDEYLGDTADSIEIISVRNMLKAGYLSEA